MRSLVNAIVEGGIVSVIEGCLEYERLKNYKIIIVYNIIGNIYNIKK